MLGTVKDSICEWWVTCQCGKCGLEEKPINKSGRHVPVTQREAVILFERSRWTALWLSSESPDEFTAVLTGVCPDCSEETQNKGTNHADCN